VTSPTPNNDAGHESQRFAAAVRRRRERRDKEEQDGDDAFWGSVGMMGTVGWSVAVPTAGGVLFGRWLDGRLDAGHVFLVFFMLVGLGVGVYIAWRMIREKL
jgi:ATP synthase protein I